MARPRNPKNATDRIELLPVAEALKAARERAGVSQRDLATQIGVATPTIARYELGLRPIPIATLVRCAGLLGSPELQSLGASNAVGSAAGRKSAVRTGLATSQFFRSNDFVKWWHRRVADFATRFQVGQTDIDDAHKMLVDVVNRSVAYTALFNQKPSHAELLARCDDAFDWLLRLNEGRRASDGVAA